MIVESWSIGAFFLFISIRFLIFQYRLFPRHHSDGWRKTTEVHHRTEQAKYIGSLFNLAVHSTHTKDRKSFIDMVVGLLSEVFRETSETHFALAWKKFAVRRVENNHTDFVYVSFSGNGAINEPELYPGKEYPLTFVQQPCLKEILLTVQDSYNMTKDLPDKKRPGILRKKILQRLAGNTPGGCSKDNKDLVDRILAATWINFLEVGVGSMERNQPHWFFHQKNSGFGVFNVHCRHSSEYTWADLWVQFSHVGMDGRAAAKLQGRIKKKMGVFNNNMKFPQDFSIPENFTQFRFPGRNVFNGCGFVDFTNFINETNHLSVEHGKILPVALLIWNLARQPFFIGKKFNVPVDVPGNARHDRTVGFVFTKPQYFTDTFSGEEAFRKYLHNFNNQVTGVRTRSGDNYLFLESSLMVPHWVLILMLRYMRSAIYSFTGSVCVTIMEGIEYGIPSLSDNVDAIISISLPVGTDVISGCISIRSSSDNIKPIFDAVKNVVRNQVDPVNSLKQSSW
jgi:hypothetical protein